ncbi:protein-tyrosine phosphatase-like protein [Trichophaea hybrida]|nr:protein-tyrosine phosphatase-like protein [Trichophaea hybrida]
MSHGQSYGVGRSSRSRSRRQEKGIPKFLVQSTTDIRRKFLELENLQNDRLRQSLINPDDTRWKIEDSTEVRSRNRYSNVSAWESNRVHLKVPEAHCDYINASPIVLKSRKDGSIKRYIATQGPKQGQFNHMWRMIWQETGDVAVVVMLTKTFELGRDKCFQYFPEDDPEPWEIRDDGEFGDGFNATVALLEKKKDPRSSCTVRKLLMKVGDKQKIVWHLLFKGWPDYNVPEGDEKSALLELIKLANEKNSGPDNPLIVHCNAGVGRSGTFITLDHFIRDIDAGALTISEREDVVFETVNQLREQRMYMVQSEVQFQFIYIVLRERFMRRSKSSSPPLILDELREEETHHSA